MFKKLNDFKKRLNKLKTVDPQTNENKVLTPKVLDNVGDLFNDLFYVYKDKYNEGKRGLNTKNKKLFYYKNLRLTDDYQYGSEEEKQQTSKKPNKRGEQSDELRLPKWIKVSKPRFNVIKKKVQSAKNYRLDQKGVKLLILTNQTNYFMK